eukprot:4053123-Karenia_brevis.AAC.1
MAMLVHFSPNLCQLTPNLAQLGPNLAPTWSPDNGRGGYQGVCWKCRKKGHKSFECPEGSMIHGVDDGWVDKPQVQVEGGVRTV